MCRCFGVLGEAAALAQWLEFHDRCRKNMTLNVGIAGKRQVCRLWHLFEVQRNEKGLVTPSASEAAISGHISTAEGQIRKKDSKAGNRVYILLPGPICGNCALF